MVRCKNEVKTWVWKLSHPKNAFIYKILLFPEKKGCVECILRRVLGVEIVPSDNMADQI